MTPLAQTPPAPSLPAPPGYLRIVWLLLTIARRRATARTAEQLRVLQARIGPVKLRQAGMALFILLMAGINALAALGVQVAVSAGQRQEATAQGLVVVENRFVAEIDALQRRAAAQHWTTQRRQTALEHAYGLQARTTALFYGGNENAILTDLKDTVPGVTDAPLRDRRRPDTGFAGMPPPRSLAGLFTSALLLMWSAMLIFQGEGLDLEVQRARHPMWEFLFSHPVPPSAVFLAESLAPLAANPIFYSAPLFAGMLYTSAYGPWLGALAAILAGIPITMAASCLGKALEISVVLRFPARSRGAMVGLMSWLGYSCMMLLGAAAFTIGELMHAAAYFPALAKFPWPLLDIFLGRAADGHFAFARGILTCDAIAALAIAASLRLSLWGAREGLIGGGQRVAERRPASIGQFGRNAFYRKELLWLLRDRNAAVQAILIPATLAGFQLLNLRLVLSGVMGAWNLLCGTAILFGVYVLSVLCPKSLASEGAALWMTLTWPDGLENLLRAKARLWSIIATVIVGLALAAAAVRFPANALQIALVAVGWCCLARFLSEKSVTLVTPSTENGQTQKIPLGLRLAAQLGTFTFSIGVITQQWSLVLAGVVYTGVTARAMWRDFAARLPFFYDPWSARQSLAPSLAHAMIAISTLVELGALFGAAALVPLGTDQAALATALTFALLTPLVALAAHQILRGQAVRLAQIWRWPGQPTALPAAIAWPAAIAAGLALGRFGQWLQATLAPFAAAAAAAAHVAAASAALPHARQLLTLLAVTVLPLAEEYLFRGLLYRALDRDWASAQGTASGGAWGGWGAVLASAALFALYHPITSWPLMLLLGIATALVFKRTGRLTDAVLLHVACNAMLAV